MAADNLLFAGPQGQNLAALTAELAGWRSDLAALIAIAPGVEVRSTATGDLRLGSDWNLAPANGQRVGEPTVLTLRAANNLYLPFSLSDGFSALATNSGLLGGSAASFRFVAGADFYAADPLATGSAAAQGDLVIGRAASAGGATPPVVLLRTTTGSIELAAARDVVTFVETARPGSDVDRRSQVRVYTTGTAVAAANTPEFNRLGIRVSDQFLRNQSVVVGPFFEGAGDIAIRAGRDILGSPAAVYGSNAVQRSQYVTDWWYRQANTGSSSGQAEGVALWSRYDVFAQGFASFGGGSIRADAGRDIIDLDLSTPATGYRVAGSATAAPAARWFAGGTLDVSAGRDVVGGLLNAGGTVARLVADGELKGERNPAQAGGYALTQLFYGDTAWTVTARSHLNIGSPTQPGLLSGAFQGNEAAPRTDIVTHLAPDASIALTSLSGNVSIVDARPTSTSGTTPGASAATVPDGFTVAAPNGGISAATLQQRPVGDSTLQLLAREGVGVDRLQLLAPVTQGAALPRTQSQAAVNELFSPITREWSRSEGEADAGPGAPARLVSLTGDVSLAAVTSFSARALRLIAERDLRLDGTLLVQHPADPDAAGLDRARQLSLLQAGRDIQFGSLGGLRMAGRGDVVAIAGRDIDLGRGAGIVSIGNQENEQQLGRGGASITLLAGVRGSDYTQAAARNFHLLGSGFETVPAALAVQLESLQASGRLLDSAAAGAAAQAFAELSPQAQRDRVAALVGEAALNSRSQAYLDQAVARAESLSQSATDAALSGAVSGSGRAGASQPVPGSEFLAGETLFPANAGSAERDALQAGVRERLRSALQPQALADALARYAAGLDAATQQSLALAVSPYAARLQSFVAQRTGRAVGSAAEASEQFVALAPEEQALFLNQVLTSELRSAGRAAVTGQRTAYLRGFDAMDALFPGARPAGRITLSNSQVKTAQGGDVRLFAPGGSINVGDLAGGGIVKPASDVGIVTVAGGEVDAVVRNSVEVNQSRIFTLDQGDVMLWARLGNLDAGRGAKTVTGSPPPLVTINSQGQVVVDTSGSFSGSGIAVLDAASTLDLYAPMGEINAGEAGIQSAGNAFLGASRFVGADNLAVGGVGVGAPAKPPEAPTASLAGIAQTAGTASAQTGAVQEDEDERRRKRPRRNLFLDFLGFGQGE